MSVKDEINTLRIEWEVVKVDAYSLKPHPKNPRVLKVHQAKALVRSMMLFGVVHDPIINLDNHILSGHQRVALLKTMGHKEIQVMRPNRMLDEKEAENLLLFMNGAQGEFDEDMLANLFDQQQLIDTGILEKEMEINEAIAGDPVAELEAQDAENCCPNCGEPLPKKKRKAKKK